MGKPWERYQAATQAEDGPWTKYQPQVPIPIGEGVTDAQMAEAASEAGPVGAFFAEGGNAAMRAVRGLKGLVGMGDSQGDVEREKLSRALHETHPTAATAGEIGGTLGTMVVGGAALKGAGAAANAGQWVRTANALRAGTAPSAVPQTLANVGGALRTAGTALNAPTSVGRAMAGAAGYGAATTAGDLDGRVDAALAGGAGAVAGYGAGKALGSVAARMKTTDAQKLALMEAQDAVKNASLQAGRDVGYVASPSTVNAGLGSRILEGLSGKYKTEQLAGIKNQRVTDSVVRRAVGMADDAPMTPAMLQSVRNEAFQSGYVPVRSAGVMQTDAAYGRALDDIVSSYRGAQRSFPGATNNGVEDALASLRVNRFDAGDAIDMTRVLRERADDAYSAGNKALGKASKQAAKALEDQIERSLGAQGAPGAQMLKQFRDARTLMAKTHSVEKALTEGTGQVSATKLAQQLAAGKPLSGELELVAKYAQAFPKLTRVPDSGNANPFTAVDFGVAGIGAGAANPMAMALPFARVGARQAILSPAYQRAFVNPNYSPARLPGLLGGAGAISPLLGAPVGLSLLGSQ